MSFFFEKCFLKIESISFAAILLINSFFLSQKLDASPPQIPITTPTPSMHLTLEADFLYWAARQDGLVSAVTLSKEIFDAPELDLSRLPQEKTHPLKWKNVPAFKVGATFYPASNNWDIQAIYTQLNTGKVPSSTHFPTGSTNATVLSPIFTFWNHFPLKKGDLLLSEDANWKLHFRVLDLTLGKKFIVSPYFDLRIHSGLKGTWQNQDLIATCLYQPSEGSQTLEVLDVSCDYEGIGMIIGLSGYWHFTRAFSLFSALSATGLYEWLKIGYIEYGEQIETDLYNLIARGKLKNTQISPIVEWQLGFNFQGNLSHGKYLYGLNIAWEMQYWGFQNPFATRGNLQLQGLTIGTYFFF